MHPLRSCIIGSNTDVSRSLIHRYEYTFTRDRLWRKNRRRAIGSSCTGVDLNRNFGYRWGGMGTSKDPCREIYAGSGPFSEPETKAIRNFFEASAANFKVGSISSVPSLCNLTLEARYSIPSLLSYFPGVSDVPQLRPVHFVSMGLRQACPARLRRPREGR